jgi:hypothetical protein
MKDSLDACINNLHWLSQIQNSVHPRTRAVVLFPFKSDYIYIPDILMKKDLRVQHKTAFHHRSIANYSRSSETCSFAGQAIASLGA